MRWECRYSSCEMMYLEFGDGDVISYLHHSPEHAEHWSFEDVLSGAKDAETRNLFGEKAVEELKAAVRATLGLPPSSAA